MKKILSVFLALLMMVSAVFAFASCDEKNSDGDKEKVEDKKDDNKEENSKKEPTVPEGYKMYDNGDIRFAYPKDWKVTNGSVVIISSENGGNNITVAYEDKTDFYDDLTADEFMDTLAPQFSALGQSVSNVKVEHLTNSIGIKLTKISLNNTVSGVSMKQTMYIIPAGDLNYVVTVTEVETDAKLVNNVFNTLCESK